MLGKLLFGRTLASSERLLSVVGVRGMASVESETRTTDSKVDVINGNLSFRPASKAALDASRRPIVLIYGWLAAKSRHIHKYGDFYLDKGFDVLHIKVEPLQILWPLRAQTVVSQIIDFVMDDSRSSQPILVHGFSVGGYLYGETLVKIINNPVVLRSLSERVRGQIFDSPVEFDGVPRGVGMAVTDIRLLQKGIKASLEGYMSAFHMQVTQHYIRSSQTVRKNPLRTPSLVFYSKSDPIGTAGPIETLIDDWRRDKIPVQSRCWDNTPHVAHFQFHPVEYIGAMNQFLQTIDFNQRTSVGLKGTSLQDTNIDNAQDIRKFAMSKL